MQLSSRPADLPRPPSSAVAALALRTGALAVGAVGADVVFDPLHRNVPLCPLHATTGLWCPLCGGLRAVDALAHGDVATAVHLNLLVIVAVPLTIAWWLAALGRARRNLPPLRVPRAAFVVAVVLVLAFAVARNLPWGHALRVT